VDIEKLRTWKIHFHRLGEKPASPLTSVTALELSPVAGIFLKRKRRLMDVNLHDPCDLIPLGWESVVKAAENEVEVKPFSLM
jgi:hypothetical protein